MAITASGYQYYLSRKEAPSPGLVLVFILAPRSDHRKSSKIESSKVSYSNGVLAIALNNMLSGVEIVDHGHVNDTFVKKQIDISVEDVAVVPIDHPINQRSRVKIPNNDMDDNSRPINLTLNPSEATPLSPPSYFSFAPADVHILTSEYILVYSKHISSAYDLTIRAQELVNKLNSTAELSQMLDATQKTKDLD